MALGTLVSSLSVIHAKERQAERIQEGKDPGVPWASRSRHGSSSELAEPTLLSHSEWQEQLPLKLLLTHSHWETHLRHI